MNLFSGDARVLMWDMSVRHMRELRRGMRLVGGGVVDVMVEMPNVKDASLYRMKGHEGAVCSSHAVQRLFTRVSLADTGRHAWMYARDAPNMEPVDLDPSYFMDLTLYHVLFTAPTDPNSVYAAPTIPVCTENGAVMWHFASVCQPHFGLAHVAGDDIRDKIRDLARGGVAVLDEYGENEMACAHALSLVL